jgi:hypothetical protein
MRHVPAALSFAALLVLSGCGPDRSGSLGPAPTVAASPSSTSSNATPPSAPESSPPPAGSAAATNRPNQTVTVQVWFNRGGKVFPTRRTRPHTTATSRLSLTELVAGPTTVESSAGVRNAVPAGIDFELKGIDGGTATVSFPPAFYDGGRDPVRLREAQVVHTLTQFPTVSRVGFQSAGQPVGWPLGRADFADLMPQIVVYGPTIGQRVTSPVPVSGWARVFEANVSLRILDASGRELATKFTLATCSCGGDYATSLAYRSATEQRGTVQVYEVSAKDGSHVTVVDIPVTLART